ncbi:hypothetical protein KXD93_05090 [Mucilaginibacter sp. BJC16-A38]|uniref:BfmA/BtgA family mobilization protein n=1 Tax=Mucilaginibacter phenanthrenivorans TaxID=1234842 RepID=UPI002156F9DB|nr:BfmA/BtgA family mobilization protein [Mucilaginibacter phenanthrenivorans]MCR8557003.1 hypothetical protein [Mucilaginibacter phenanthrenivorans]
MDISPDKKSLKKRPPEKSIRFPVGTHQKLVKLCEKLGRNQVELFIAMVDYFYRTKKDPADINDELLKNALAKNHQTYIRFIRSQEDNLLIPVKENVDRMIVNQREIVRYFNEQVLNANKTIQQQQEAQARQLDAIGQQLDNKEKLKVKFGFILTNYTRALQNTPPKERDALLQEAKQQVSKL